jgi:hypothetical protein
MSHPAKMRRVSVAATLDPCDLHRSESTGNSQFLNAVGLGGTSLSESGDANIGRQLCGACKVLFNVGIGHQCIPFLNTNENAPSPKKLLLQLEDLRHSSIGGRKLGFVPWLGATATNYDDCFGKAEDQILTPISARRCAKADNLSHENIWLCQVASCLTLMGAEQELFEIIRQENSTNFSDSYRKRGIAVFHLFGSAFYIIGLVRRLCSKFVRPAHDFEQLLFCPSHGEIVVKLFILRQQW